MREGDPVMVLTAAPSQSLAAELHRLLPDLRALIGPGRRCTVVFDRGGYSPAVFAEILAAGFEVLTYYKGTWARSPLDAFTTLDFTAPDSTTHHYELAERAITLPVPGQRATPDTPGTPAGTVTLRLIVRRAPTGHQTPILTSRTDLTAAEVAYRMSNRWRQENYFKYAREHFALDALDSYADHPDDLTRLVPNPAKAHANDHVAARPRRPDRRPRRSWPTRSTPQPPKPDAPAARPPSTRPPTTPSPQPRPSWPPPRPPPAPPPATCPWDRSGPAAGYWRPNANCSPTPSG